jgi:polysaccharide pyruvyl transferase WcaK-like protein
MEAVLAYLRATHPEAVLDSICTQPDVVTERYGIPADQLRWYQADRAGPSAVGARLRRYAGLAIGIVIDAYQMARWVRRHDAVIVPGMGILETTVPMRPWKTPYWVFLLCVTGRLLHTKVALVSVGANVTDRRLTRWLITTAVRSAHYRSYRDEVSRDAIRKMGVDTTGHLVCPDVAFALPVPRGVERVAGSVGIGIMDYSGNNDEIPESPGLRANYLEQVKCFAKWLVDSGRPIRLFTSDTADEPVVQEIATDVRAHRPDLGPDWVIAQPAPSLSLLMQQIAQVETVVATRYHNVLYALLQTKPTLALGYATKHERLMAESGLPGFCLRCRTLDADRMIEVFAELERGSARLRSAIAESNAARIRLVDQQLAEMSVALFPRADAIAALEENSYGRSGL